MSVKRIQGWTPTTQYLPIRDATGKTVGWTTQEESEWDDEQIALLLAYQRETADIGPHGQPMSEATSPSADVNLRGKGWHYEPFHRIDHAEQEIERHKKKLAHDYPDSDFAGFIYGVRRVEDE